jgi:hypothetical protein
VVFDWSVGRYQSPGSHQRDRSVAILRGGGDRENLARGPGCTFYMVVLGSVSYEGFPISSGLLVVPSERRTILILSLRVCQYLCGQGVEILVKATLAGCE